MFNVVKAFREENPTSNLKINIMYHNHTFGGFKCEAIVYSISFGETIGFGYACLGGALDLCT